MYVVDSEARLSGQGLCFICEKAIDHPKEKAIRTGHDFDPMFHTPLAGDKYVCQGCAETLAWTLGFIAPDKAEALHAAAFAAQARFSQLQELVAGISTAELPVPASTQRLTVTATKEKDGS